MCGTLLGETSPSSPVFNGRLERCWNSQVQQENATSVSTQEYLSQNAVQPAPFLLLAKPDIRCRNSTALCKLNIRKIDSGIIRPTFHLQFFFLPISCVQLWLNADFSIFSISRTRNCITFDSRTNPEMVWQEWKMLCFISFPCHSSAYFSKIWSNFLSRPWVFPHRNEEIVIAG